MEQIGIEVAKVQKGSETVDGLTAVPVLRDVLLGFIIAFIAILAWGLSLDDERD